MGQDRPLRCRRYRYTLRTLTSLKEVIKMVAPPQGASMGVPNLAISLILDSVQNAPKTSRTPSHNQGLRQSPPMPANTNQTQHIDIKA